MKSRSQKARRKKGARKAEIKIGQRTGQNIAITAITIASPLLDGIAARDMIMVKKSVDTAALDTTMKSGIGTSDHVTLQRTGRTVEANLIEKGADTRERAGRKRSQRKRPLLLLG